LGAIEGGKTYHMKVPIKAHKELSSKLVKIGSKVSANGLLQSYFNEHTIHTSVRDSEKEKQSIAH
jgi:hypothetical protein